MRIQSIYPILLIAITFFSCSKELSNEDGFEPTANDDGLLVRTILKDDVSTLENNFVYNASNQLIQNRINVVAGVFTADLVNDATRDGVGRINKARWVIKSSLNPGGDTLFYELFRNNAGRVSYFLLKPVDFNVVGYDSIVCVYNASNKLVTEIVYLVDAASGMVEPFQRFELTYSGENLVTAKEYELNGTITAMRLVETTTLTYDTNPAAMAVKDDEYLVGLGTGLPAVNNVLTNTVQNEDDPSVNVTTAYKYVYGSSGKPTSAEVTTTRPGIPPGIATTTYFYK